MEKRVDAELLTRLMPGATPERGMQPLSYIIPFSPMVSKL